MAEILIMEPDERLGTKMSNALSHAGHHCTVSQTVADGLCHFNGQARMLTVLNARLPWVDSFTLLRTLEEKGWPILFITADEANRDHLRAMYQAGCDVLLSPFDAKQLLTAVNALVLNTSQLLTLGGLQLDVRRKQATKDGHPLALTAQEFALLQALMQSPDAALSREQLLRTAWGYQNVGETRTVDVHVQRLRRKIGSGCIETVYKLGYRLRLA